jgi:hypothetical protein
MVTRKANKIRTEMRAGAWREDREVSISRKNRNLRNCRGMTVLANVDRREKLGFLALSAQMLVRRLAAALGVLHVDPRHSTGVDWHLSGQPGQEHGAWPS